MTNIPALEQMGKADKVDGKDGPGSAQHIFIQLFKSIRLITENILSYKYKYS